MTMQAINRIFNSDCTCMRAVKNGSVDLVITSPPYNVGKAYELGQSYEQWLAMMSKVLSECWRVLKPAGRLCINVANTGRRPSRSLNAILYTIASRMGFLARGDIIWYKGLNAHGKTGWGSWRLPSNPVLREYHEYILIFSKHEYGRKIPVGYEPEMSKMQFLSYTESVWRFNNTVCHRKIKHPATFPLELPRRLILLYSFPGDLVLDPFMGSGTTAVAALETGRNYVGYEKKREYCKLAKTRIAEYQRKQIA